MLAQLYAGHRAEPASGSGSGTCFIPRRMLKLVPNLVQEVSDRLGIENLAPDLASAVS